ncbi:AfsR/SARP family transcriptional regulator [Angustibacter sp. McL0619]|uniref:AfsR/SARP family transcriptional regulator n=1 Tax=Angustibacter sp. McL0619 TaxID=3415676 RepID=UPI003CF5263B
MGEDSERQLRLLGPFRARVNDRLLVVPHSVERLLALTALVGPLARSHAAATLWPDADGTRASANLRSALSRMTSIDDGYIVVTGDVLGVREDVAVDLNDAMGWANETIYGACAASAGPPDSIGKELLPGWDEEWLINARERLRLLSTQALQSAAESLIAAGRPGEAMPYALLAVQAEPWSESANRLIIEIHARRGDPSNALRRYHRFQRALEHELGVQPGPDMVAVIRGLYPLGAPSVDGLVRRTAHRGRP